MDWRFFFSFFLFRFVSRAAIFLLFSSLPNLEITFFLLEDFFIPGIWRELAVLRRERRSCSTRLRNGWLWWKVPLRVLWLVGFGSYYCIVLLWVLSFLSLSLLYTVFYCLSAFEVLVLCVIVVWQVMCGLFTWQ